MVPQLKKTIIPVSLTTFLSLGLVITTAQAAPIDHSFNPQLSVVLNGGYTGSSFDPDFYALPGFQLGEEAELNHPGFAINEAEINIQASIDPYWYGNITVALEQHGHDTEVELEEGFIRTTALPQGFALMAGRFLSGIGYLNHHHKHQWDFVDAPLVYRAFFNTQYIDDGVQLRWVAPTSLFWEIEGEAFPGRNFPASGSGNRLGSATLSTHIGDDFGANSSWQLGLSYLRIKPNEREALLTEELNHEDHEEHDHDDHDNFLFTGQSNTVGLDAVWKWAPCGNAHIRQLIVQGEYYQRHEDGQIALGTEISSLDSDQKGAYLQTVYKFMPQWRIGLRYDLLMSENQGNDSEVLTETQLQGNDYHPHQTTVMMDYSPSEFSRFRVQYNRDHSLPMLNQIYMLQFIVSLGAHGAHAY